MGQIVFIAHVPQVPQFQWLIFAVRASINPIVPGSNRCNSWEMSVELANRLFGETESSSVPNLDERIVRPTNKDWRSIPLDEANWIYILIVSRYRVNCFVLDNIEVLNIARLALLECAASSQKGGLIMGHLHCIKAQSIEVFIILLIIWVQIKFGEHSGVTEIVQCDVRVERARKSDGRVVWDIGIRHRPTYPVWDKRLDKCNSILAVKQGHGVL
jgi:hypothetical protein